MLRNMAEQNGTQCSVGDSWYLQRNCFVRALPVTLGQPDGWFHILCIFFCFSDGNILPKQPKVNFSAGYLRASVCNPRLPRLIEDWDCGGNCSFWNLIILQNVIRMPFKTAGWAHQKYCSIWKHCFSILVWEPIGLRTSYSHLFCSWKTMVVPERNDGHVTLVSFRSFFSGYRRPMPYSGQVKTESNFLLLEPPFLAPRIAVKQPEPIPSSKLI